MSDERNGQRNVKRVAATAAIAGLLLVGVGLWFYRQQKLDETFASFLVQARSEAMRENWLEAYSFLKQARQLGLGKQVDESLWREVNEGLVPTAEAGLETAATARDSAAAQNAARYVSSLWENAESMLAAGKKTQTAGDIGAAIAHYEEASGLYAEAGKVSDRIRNVVERIGEEMVIIEGGSFDMGSPPDEETRRPDEGPVHEVAVGSFYLSKYEVTVGQFKAFRQATGYLTDAETRDGAQVFREGTWQTRPDANWSNPYFPQTDDQPATCISWNDASAYCAWLSEAAAKKYRLPTEAEWEYACRAGTRTRHYWGDDGVQSHEYVNTADQSAKRSFPLLSVISGDDGYVYTAPVGSFKPNGFGLYDMSGNVFEWCADWYGQDYYQSSPRDNPTGPLSGEIRVLRGGSWRFRPNALNSANRGRNYPTLASAGVGFRIAGDP